MPSSAPLSVAAASVAGLVLFPTSRVDAQSSELLYSNPSNSSYTAVQSYALPESSFPLSFEAADDFFTTGLVTRVVVHGKQCFPCSPADVSFATVRFYEWTPAGPGALLDEQSLAAGDPAFVYDVTGVDDVELTLPEAVFVDGPGFVSVQLTMGADQGYWAWWISNHEAPTGSPFWWRSATQGGEWGLFDPIVGDELQADLAFSLWGSTGQPPEPSTDPCGQWSSLSTPDPAGASRAILRAVAAISDDDVWAVGEATVEVLPGNDDIVVQALHWDGAGWVEHAVPVPDPYPGGGTAILSAVAAAASDDVWAAGTYSTIGVDGFVSQEVLIVHWDGDGWSLVPDAPLLDAGLSGAWLRGIEILAPDDIWFVGDFPIDVNGFGVRYAGAIHYDGRDFTIYDTPLNNTDGNGLSGVAALAPDDIWAVGGGYNNGFLIDPYVVHFDGSTWDLVPTPKPGIVHALFDVVAIATDDVWTVGQVNTGTGIVGFAMHWDGNSWSEVPFSGGSLGLEAFATDDVYSVGGVVSHWDGAAWSVVEDFGGVLGPSMGGVDASEACKLFAVGRQSVAGNLRNFSAKLDADPWTDLAGGPQAEPALVGVGNLEAQSAVTFQLSSMPAEAPTLLLWGSSALFLPYESALIVPSPDIVVGGLATDVFGRLDFSVQWPANVPPGATFYAQMWSLDPSASALVASNGLKAVTP